MGIPVECAAPLPVRTLRQWRRKRAWIQEDLAKHSGHSVSTVSGIERRITVPSLTVMRDIARALGVGITQVAEFAEELSRE